MSTQDPTNPSAITLNGKASRLSTAPPVLSDMAEMNPEAFSGSEVNLKIEALASDALGLRNRKPVSEQDRFDVPPKRKANVQKILTNSDDGDALDFPVVSEAAIDIQDTSLRTPIRTAQILSIAEALEKKNKSPSPIAIDDTQSEAPAFVAEPARNTNPFGLTEEAAIAKRVQPSAIPWVRTAAVFAVLTTVFLLLLFAV